MADEDETASSPLGPWSEAQLQATAEEHRNEGADEGLPASLRFLSSVTKLIKRRLAHPSAAADPAYPAIFLLKPDPDEDTAANPLMRVFVLNNGLKPLAGKVWFVSEVANSARSLSVDTEDDDHMISLVVGPLAAGCIPAILFEPRTSPATLRFYPSGLCDADDCRTISLATDFVTLDAILAEIDRCYPTLLRTPDAHPSASPLWEDSRHHWPVKQVELRIQGMLREILTAAIPSCTVLPEQPDVVGRVDLLIEEPLGDTAFAVRRTAVLELKVLRTFGSTGRSTSPQTTNDWIQGGVLQAAAYRDQRNAADCALCCFDMRRDHVGEACFDHVKDDAVRRRVRLRSWHIFNSAEAFRRHQGCAA